MRFTKHVGQIITTQQKVVVVFREIPDDPNWCLVVDTEAIPEDVHNDLMNEVESLGAQEKTDLYDHLHTHFFRDGSNMLEKLHTDRHLIRIEVTNVMMTPTSTDNIPLLELNKQLKVIKDNPDASPEQLQQLVQEEVIAGDEVKPPSISQKDDGVLDDATLAKGFIAQAEGMEAEAKRLREQAYELVPKRKLNNMLKKENVTA